MTTQHKLNPLSDKDIKGVIGYNEEIKKGFKVFCDIKSAGDRIVDMEWGDSARDIDLRMTSMADILIWAVKRRVMGSFPQYAGYEWQINELGLAEVVGADEADVFECAGAFSNHSLNATEFSLALTAWASNDILWEETTSDRKNFFEFMYHYSYVLMDRNYTKVVGVDIGKVMALLD